MKICMITSMHPPEDGRIFQKEAVSLSKKYDVSLIAPGKTFSKDTAKGVSVTTVKKPKSRLFHFITLYRIYKAALQEDADIYHCHEPDALFIGTLLKKRKKKIIVYDVHEHWPSMAALTAFGPFGPKIVSCPTVDRAIQKITECFELYLAKKADMIITVSDSVAERFTSIGLQTTNIMNVPMITQKMTDIHTRNPNEIGYVCGKLGFSKGVDVTLKTIDTLIEDYSDIHLTLIGNIQYYALGDIDSQLKDHIEITGFLPYDEMYRRICECGIGLILFQNTHYNSYIGLPNKLFDYMMCGLPVVASDFPEIRKVVNTSECGVLVDTDDVHNIVSGIRYLLDNPNEALKMGENGRRMISSKYNWKIMEKILLDLYEPFQIGE